MSVILLISIVVFNRIYCSRVFLKNDLNYFFDCDIYLVYIFLKKIIGIGFDFGVG